MSTDRYVCLECHEEFSIESKTCPKCGSNKISKQVTVSAKKEKARSFRTFNTSVNPIQVLVTNLLSESQCSIFVQKRFCKIHCLL